MIACVFVRLLFVIVLCYCSCFVVLVDVRLCCVGFVSHCLLLALFVYFASFPSLSFLLFCFWVSCLCARVCVCFLLCKCMCVFVCCW